MPICLYIVIRNWSSITFWKRGQSFVRSFLNNIWIEGYYKWKIGVNFKLIVTVSNRPIIRYKRCIINALGSAECKRIRNYSICWTRLMYDLKRSLRSRSFHQSLSSRNAISENARIRLMYCLTDYVCNLPLSRVVITLALAN